jgi:hypothetical protein
MATGGRSPHPNALPNYQNAVILRSQLEQFSLDPTHYYGKHHARVFKSALGLISRIGRHWNGASQRNYHIMRRWPERRTTMASVTK